MLSVEAYATGIKIFNWQKVCYIAWSFPSEALDRLILRGQVSNCSCVAWSFDFRGLGGYLDPLNGSQKRFLITWFSFDTTQTLLLATWDMRLKLKVCCIHANLATWEQSYVNSSYLVKVSTVAIWHMPVPSPCSYLWWSSFLDCRKVQRLNSTHSNMRSSPPY